MTKDDEIKIREYVRSQPRHNGANDGEAWFEHAVKQKIEMFKWSLEAQPGAYRRCLPGAG